MCSTGPADSINGCPDCLIAHAHTRREAGVSRAAIFDALKITAIVEVLRRPSALWDRPPDYDGNLATQLALQTRIRQIHDLMINANFGEDRLYDGIAEANHLKYPGHIVGCAIGDFVMATRQGCQSPGSPRHFPYELFN